jgi:hypothetical protein
MTIGRGVAIALLGAAAGLAGCSTVAHDLRPWESTTPNSRYDPALSTSRDCINAAKRATYWCEKVNKDSTGAASLHIQGQNTDVYACNDAQRDFHRYCR